MTKLMFVARLREYTPLSDDADAMRVLGSAQVSATLFDQWWSIRRLYMEESQDELEGYLAAVRDKIALTGNDVVDRYLDARARKISD